MDWLTKVIEWIVGLIKALMGQSTPLPEPEVVNTIKYGILRNLPLENNLLWTPATVKLNDRPVPDMGKGAVIPVFDSAWEFIRAINNDKGYNYARSVHEMWINTDYSDSEPAHAESISCSGNFVSWEIEENGCYKLRCFNNDEDMARFIGLVDWYSRPDVIFKATAISDDLRLANVGNATDCFIPLMCRHSNNGTGELWAAKAQVEPFPELPINVKITANILNAREKPGDQEKILDAFVAGEMVKIYEYRPLGASVWGKTIKGWICLLYAPMAGVLRHFTSWSLESPGVIPPA